LRSVNLALVGVVILKFGQARVKERPSTLDKDGSSARPITKVSTPLMAPPKVIESNHALVEFHPFEDVKII